MVLDTRFLHGLVHSPPPGEPASGGAGGGPVADGTQPGTEKWAELLREAVDASHAGEFVTLVQRLRQTLPDDDAIPVLWSILSDPADSRRCLAALVLGYHRMWLNSNSRVRSMVAMAHREEAVGVARAMVWCLRRQDCVASFLSHPDVRVAREAALGVVVTPRSLPDLLRALLVATDLDSDLERVLLHKLHAMHPSTVSCAVGYLLETEAVVCLSRLPEVFACFPQLPLFQLLVEQRQLPEWSPQKAEDAERVRRWQRMVVAAREVVMERPGLALMRHLLTRSSEDEAFARRHARLLHVAMQRADMRAGGSLIAHFDRLTRSASEERVARLAELLVELCGRLQGDHQDRARSLLKAWKSRSTDLRLRIYQMENRLKS